MGQTLGKNIAILWIQQQFLHGTTLLRTLKGRAGKIKMRNTCQEAAAVSCHTGLFEGEPLASFTAKSTFYAPEQANHFVHESALFLDVSSSTLFSIFCERKMTWFLTIKSLMSIRSLDKSGRKSPFREEKTVTEQVNRSARLLPKVMQCDFTCQS